MIFRSNSRNLQTPYHIQVAGTVTGFVSLHEILRLYGSYASRVDALSVERLLLAIIKISMHSVRAWANSSVLDSQSISDLGYKKGTGYNTLYRLSFRRGGVTDGLQQLQIEISAARTNLVPRYLRVLILAIHVRKLITANASEFQDYLWC